MTVNSNSREIIGEVSFVENCAYELSEGEKILCVTARADCFNKEALSNEFRLSIKTTFRALIIKDNEYEVRERISESVKSVVHNGIVPTSDGVFSAAVQKCEYNNGQASAEIKINGWFLKENTLSYFAASDDIHCRTSQITVRNVPNILNSRLTLTHSDECRMPIKTLLDCSPNLIINNVYPSDNSFRIEGELDLRIAAVTDNNQFLTQTFCHSFTTEVEANCSVNSFVDAEGKVKKLEITLTEGDSRIIITDAEVAFFCTVAEEKEINAVIDCYSVKNELATEYVTIGSDKEFCIRSVRDKCSSTLTPGGEISELYCALYPTVNADAVKDNDVVKIQGIVYATVLYADEQNVVTGKVAEIPFSTEMGKAECESVTPSVSINALSCRLKTGKDIEVSAEISCTVHGSAKEEIKVVSSVTQGEEKPEDDYAISLYIVKPNEELWDVAKALNSDEDTLLKLNPELKLPLSGGEKVLIYKELLFNM